MDPLRPLSSTLDLTLKMESVCDLCRFIPTIRHPPISRDQFRSGLIKSDDLVLNKTIIAEEERNIQWYLSEISRVQNILSDLEKEKRALEVQVQERQSHVSLLQRIPQELWIEIFSYFCVRGEHDQWGIPFKLSSICYRWREIVMPTPALWSTIVLNMRCKHQERGLQFYLLHSAEHDLDLRVDDYTLCGLPSRTQEGPEEGEEEEEENEEDNLEAAKYRSSSLQMLLWDNMRRVRNLSIVQSYEILPFPNHQPPGLSFQRLQLLKIVRYTHYPSWFWDAVHEAPQLRKLVVNSDSLWESDVLSNVARPGSNLPSLEVSSALSGETFIKAMQDLPALEHLIINKLHSLRDDPPIAKVPPTICRTLRSLIIHGIDKSISILVILQSLRLPNLDSLDINWIWTRESRQDDALLTLSGFAPSLRKLIIRGIDLLAPLDKLLDILRALPDLVEFAFVAYSIPQYDEYGRATESANSFISSLFLHLTHTIQTNSSRLHSISIHLLAEAEEMLKSLLGMSEAWVIGNYLQASNLKRLHFSANEFLYPDEDGLTSQLKALEGKGFEMRYGDEEKREVITIRYEA
ncbi:hypothetical protein AAF712_015659 [Marasmius tenuissimus]|uniref:F-box domain-containing protein n=1 Tax=Marasmius tenuissimus TaxID=585030 RepID=A0ABR2Z8Y5_9AGAR